MLSTMNLFTAALAMACLLSSALANPIDSRDVSWTGPHTFNTTGSVKAAKVEDNRCCTAGCTFCSSYTCEEIGCTGITVSAPLLATAEAILRGICSPQDSGWLELRHINSLSA